VRTEYSKRHSNYTGNILAECRSVNYRKLMYNGIHTPKMHVIWEDMFKQF